MGYKLLSFLGCSRYHEAYYEYMGKKTKNYYQFVQEALLELFCKDVEGPARVIVFVTDEAEKKNWLSKCECEDANFEKGLKERLKDTVRKLGVDATFMSVKIPDGKSEEELWEIFERINDSIEEKDTLIFDITHGFRSLPMLTLVTLNYVRFLKNVEIDRIVYGAMEVLGSYSYVAEMPVEERIVPVFDLTPFVSLFDWTIAIERFLQTGSAEMVESLSKSRLKPLLSKTRGKEGRSLRRFVEHLNSFSQDVSTCRAPEFINDIKRISDSLCDAEKELGNLKPIGPLFEKVKKRFGDVNIKDDISCGLEVTSWCLEKGLIQQGFTLLRETIVNYVIAEVLGKKEPEYLKNGRCRGKAEKRLNEMDKSVPPDILKLWNEIKDYRNDINHSGWRHSCHSSESFEKKLEDFVNRFRSFVESRN